MSTNEGISKSLEPKLQHSWKKLTEGKHYLIPETIEDIKALGPFPYFQIGDIWVFAKDLVKETVSEMSELLRKELGHHRFTANTIDKVIRDEIKTHFSEKEPHPFQWHIDRILAAIRSHDHRRQYIKVVSGLKLKDIDEISYGSWIIRRFSEDDAKEFSSRGSAPEDWREHVGDVLKKDYLGKTCISLNCRGDQDQSRLNAEYVAKYIINCLRLFMCVHVSEGGLQHEFEIGLDAPPRGKTISCSFDIDDQQHSMRFEYGSKRQSYILNAQNLQIINEPLHGEWLWSLIEKEQRTDLEDSLVTAVTWFGDAQQETDSHVAYIKYWTALEALVTGHEKEQLVSRLKATIPVLISQGSKDIPSKSRVAKAYDLRSQIIHRGSRAQLRRSDLNQVCDWAWQCIVVALHLTTRGYKTRQQVEQQASKVTMSKGGEKGKGK